MYRCPFSKFNINIDFSAIKAGLERNCETAYSGGGVDQDSKDLLIMTWMESCHIVTHDTYLLIFNDTCRERSREKMRKITRTTKIK